MKNERTGVLLGVILAVAVLLSAPTRSALAPFQNGEGLLAGRNVNMVSGQQLPWGDPFLQRQNEPSIAVSTRNPMHLLAGANDYRTVDMLIPYEELPGPPEGMAAARDAWLGVYKSFDGGQSWQSGLLPGFPQDYTGTGLASPLKAYGTAADAVVRPATNGLFYMSGIAFNRNAQGGGLFIARFIDNNNKEKGDTIKYLGAAVLDKGTPGQFIDKPWLAVDLPRSSSKVTIDGQAIPAHNVYLAYTIFLGQTDVNVRSKVLLARSTNCGLSWGQPVKLSESQHVNQGVTIAVDPRNTGILYVAWRRFAHGGDPDAILVCRSADGGQTFSKPVAITTLTPFDQGSTAISFRTNSYPSLAVDHNGLVYAAWSQRPAGDMIGPAKVFMSASADGATWSTPMKIDGDFPGHQVMPSLTYAMGRVVCVWYDQRRDISGRFSQWIDDIPGATRHTLDVRAAEIAPGTTALARPTIQVSRYLWTIPALTDTPVQAQWSRPNYPLFKEGTRAFYGDYVDLAPAPMFVPGPNGGWVYNMDASQTPVFHAAWTDNRDVRPPGDGDWSHYTPPASSQEDPFGSGVNCEVGQTSLRNQNVYTASLTGGLVVGSPGNNKPLGPNPYGEAIKHTFVVYVKNLTASVRSFRLTIEAPMGVDASFLQGSDLATLDVTVAPASSIARTVFASSTLHPDATIQVLVKEISAPGGGEVPEGLKGAVILNPDIENPDIENPDIENPDIENPDIENYEVHNPDIENPDIENPDIENTQVINPDIENPDIENNDIINPDIENPDIENPDIENLNIMNPDIENPTIMTPDIENGSLSDYTWRVKNIGNTASSYRFRMIAAGFEASDYPGFGFQLLIYRVYTSPVAANCTLKQTHHDELLANIVGPDIINPDIENPDIENPDIENPDIENATFWLAPGDEAYITLRVYDPNENDDVKFDFNETPIEGVTTAQSVNSQDEIAGKTVPPIASPYSNLTIYNSSLPNGETDTSYTAYLVALGGTPHYTWSYSGTLPPGVSFNGATGVLFGTPTTAGTFPFTAQVTDSANPPNTASENLQIVISPPCTVSTPDIPTGTATGGINVAYTFTTGGATDSQGHPVEYRLEWSPGQYTGWSSSSAISVTFTTTETYQIKAQARCQLHNSVTSPWSAAKKVTIYNSVSTIQGYLTYNANPVTNMPDASGKQAEIILTDETTYQRFPSTPTYDTSTGFYSIPNIPQGTYGFEVRIDAGAPSNGKHLPGDYDGITNNVSVPTGPTVVTQNLSVQKLLHLLAPIDNSIVQHWPGPVFDIFTSPLLMDWDVLSEAAFYRYRADKVDSSDYHVIWTTDYIDTTASQVSLTLTPNSSAPPDHYQFSLYAYNSSNLLVGKLMLEYVSGYGWDYRFRIAPGDITPPVVSSLTPAAGATDVAFAAPLSISFDENVMKGTGNIVIKKSANDAVFQTIDVTSGLVTIASDVVTISHDVLGAATGYYVQVEATCFDDLAGNSYGGISDTTTWSFTATDIPGLLAYYPFNANAADASGNGNDGTIQGSAPVFVPDRLGQANGALQFNGDNNYVDLPNESSFDLTTFTIVAIIKVQDFSRPNHIISKGPEFGNYTLRIDGGIDPFSGEAAYYHQTGTGNWSAPVSASVIAQNEFVHLAVTLNTSSYFGYMNGQQTYTGGGPPPPVLNNDLVTIGRAMLSSTPRYFLGVVDEIRIYNRVLSDNEIKALYNRDR